MALGANASAAVAAARGPAENVQAGELACKAGAVVAEEEGIQASEFATAPTSSLNLARLPHPFPNPLLQFAANTRLKRPARSAAHAVAVPLVNFGLVAAAATLGCAWHVQVAQQGNTVWAAPTPPLEHVSAVPPALQDCIALHVVEPARASAPRVQQGGACAPCSHLSNHALGCMPLPLPHNLAISRPLLSSLTAMCFVLVFLSFHQDF